MPEPDPPAILPYQVLADPTGRRRRRLAIAGRVATTALGLWLAVLILGGLGLQPLAGLPIFSHLGAREAAPPALPNRLRAAVARGATVAPAAQPPQTSVGTLSTPSRRSTVTKPFRSRTQHPEGTTPASAPGRTKTSPAHALASPMSAPAITTTSPSSTAPGQTKTGTSPSSTAPGQTKTGTSPSSTAPGQTRTAPGQTKTGTGPPTATPGGTPGANSKAYRAAGALTAP